MRIASARYDAIARGATTAELQKIEAEVESLRVLLKASDLRHGRIKECCDYPPFLI